MKIRPNASGEIKAKALASGGRVEFYSFFPIDRASCDCHQMIHDWKQKLAPLSGEGSKEAVARQRFLVCPRSKVGMKRHKVDCINCGETQGYCWATDQTLKDWCDFHYTNWSDGNKWYGCIGPHVSPITEQLHLECACGQDTRDFRANMNMDPKKAHAIEKENQKGREFGRSDSKFKVSVVGDNVVAFNKNNG